MRCSSRRRSRCRFRVHLCGDRRSRCCVPRPLARSRCSPRAQPSNSVEIWSRGQRHGAPLAGSPWGLPWLLWTAGVPVPTSAIVRAARPFPRAWRSNNGSAWQGRSRARIRRSGLRGATCKRSRNRCPWSGSTLQPACRKHRRPRNILRRHLSTELSAVGWFIAICT